MARVLEFRVGVFERFFGGSRVGVFCRALFVFFYFYIKYRWKSMFCYRNGVKFSEIGGGRVVVGGLRCRIRVGRDFLGFSVRVEDVRSLKLGSIRSWRVFRESVRLEEVERVFRGFS